MGGPPCVGGGEEGRWPHCPVWGPRPVGEAVPRKPLVHPPLLLTSTTSSANHSTQATGFSPGRYFCCEHLAASLILFSSFCFFLSPRNDPQGADGEKEGRSCPWRRSLLSAVLGRGVLSGSGGWWFACPRCPWGVGLSCPAGYSSISRRPCRPRALRMLLPNSFLSSAGTYWVPAAGQALLQASGDPPRTDKKVKKVKGIQRYKRPVTKQTAGTSCTARGAVSNIARALSRGRLLTRYTLHRCRTAVLYT